MSNHPHINAAVLGYGFMGRTHAKAYQDAQRAGYPVTLTAIADANLKDINQSKTAGNIESDQQSINTENITFFNDAQSLISDPDIDLISICTHTDSHVDLAIEALSAGKHVLVEKPIAINPIDVQRLVEAAQRSKTLCIPAMCMRHWPAWTTIHELITTNKHNQLELGPLRSAAFHRLGSRPTWGADFYKDQSRSGGVLQDLHIHDTDFIVHCLGKPNAVTTTGDPLHLTTLYDYDNIPHITAQGAWDQQPSAGFQMKCTITFENATLDFDLSRDPQLILHHADESTPLETSPLTGYDQEIRWTIDQIVSNTYTTKPIEDALTVAKILQAESQSMQSNKPVELD